MDDKIKLTLNKVLDLFQSDQVPEALATTVLPSLDVPSSRWSVSNRLLMFLNNTSDARGYRQWRRVGRWPKKGANAFGIICPQIGKKVNDDGEDEEVVLGFRCVPVFRFEDTEGKELVIDHLPPQELPPLYDVAQKWGIDVAWKALPSSMQGVYSSSRKTIELCTYEEDVFFHELAHAAHDKAVGDFTREEQWRREIVAELSAVVLAHIYGKHCNTGGHYQYIDHYAQQADLEVYQACMAVVGDVKQCLDLILKAEQEISIAA